MIIKAFVNNLRMQIKNTLTRVLLGFVALLTILNSGCQTATRKSPGQQFITSDREEKLSQELTRNLTKNFGESTDPKVRDLLNELALRIVAASSFSARLAKINVRLLATQAPYIAAGLNQTIYISTGALGETMYENELAFLLATQIVLIKNNVPTTNLASLQGQSLGQSLAVLPTAPGSLDDDHLNQGWFEPGGLFDFGNEAYLKAEKEAIQLIYAANYDPRGAVTLIQRWTSVSERKKHRALGKILPESDERLRAAREEVAKLSPVRDPIVKSVAYEELKTRLNTKKAKNKKAVSK
jgi:predicted Zn-dependent protease